MSEQPATYIRTALSSLGIVCRAVDIQNYDPELFGNLVAMAETDRGYLHIVYDRGFTVEARHWQPGSPSLEQITAAFEQHKLAHPNGS